jgi:uncharacterized protein
MKFEYGPSKAVSNLTKHKVSFEEAASVFGDEMAYSFADPDHSLGEERWLIYGYSHARRILAVIYTCRRGTYRIISARVATKYERKIYEED